MGTQKLALAEQVLDALLDGPTTSTELAERLDWWIGPDGSSGGPNWRKVNLIMRELEQHGWATQDGNRWALTTEGRDHGWLNRIGPRAKQIEKIIEQASSV